MPILPNADRAVVAEEKLREYLLSPVHPIGRFKARFFASAGYTIDNWQELAAELLRHAREGDANEGMSTVFGQKYEVRAILGDAVRGTVLVSVWIIRQNEDFPRLVTAYPG